MRLYKVYVRPILEYCIQAVGPYSEGDKLCLERVQKRAVGMVSNIARGSYEEKLKELKLTTLEERRWRGDMIQTWRIMTGKDRVDASTWFDLEADSQELEPKQQEMLQDTMPSDPGTSSTRRGGSSSPTG